MKRKRGSKKGKKAKGPPVVAVQPNEGSQNSEYTSGGGDDYDNNEYEFGMEVDTPIGSDQPVALSNINPDGSTDKVVGKSIGCVKVKVKTPKLLESDILSHNDTDKSSPNMCLDRPVVVAEKMDDSVSSFPEIKTSVAGVSKKAGSIKIKSSRALSGSSIEKSLIVQDDNFLEKELKTPNRDPRNIKQELDVALSVIKKVMKMEAAEPFNVPVNPKALGIPDYFDVIDTPMDFGTVCSNLENSDKYMSSKDVYEDVRYIWENCCKYNNKGDYIVDLMRRVKKNFMKYWIGAGLYSEQARGGDYTEMEDDTHSSQGKVSTKSGQSKQKTHKRHGRRHKSDCLCAICVLKRRKREREETAKQEESSLIESPCEDSSLYIGGESLDLDAEAEVEGKVEGNTGTEAYSPMIEKYTEDDEEDEEAEEKDNEIKIEKSVECAAKDKSQFCDGMEEEPNRLCLPGRPENSGHVLQSHSQEGHTSAWSEEETEAIPKQNQKERQERLEMLEKFHYENPLLLNLCGALFPENDKSVWSGPHSLLSHSRSSSACNSSSIHEAIKNLMK